MAVKLWYPDCFVGGLLAMTASPILVSFLFHVLHFVTLVTYMKQM